MAWTYPRAFIAFLNPLLPHHQRSVTSTVHLFYAKDTTIEDDLVVDLGGAAQVPKVMVYNVQDAEGEGGDHRPEIAGKDVRQGGLEAAGVSHISALCHRIAQARWFENLTVGIIILNAIVLGLETYPTLARDYGEVLNSPTERSSSTSRWRSRSA